VTVPALYYHFANKQAILVALLNHAITTVTTHIDGAVAEAGADPVKRLCAIVEAIALYSAHYREVAVLDAERRSLTAENLAAYIARRDQIERELRQTIESGCRHGVFRTNDSDTCGRAILSMCQGISVWYRPDSPRSPEETAAQYARIALAVVEAVRD
jgi:AcrR family transcriptional regulator